ncbi:MAG: exodeoxyribonuclease VII large subunit [Cognaticolwellia sp.]|jgi:exodeoxyribonuclease VII large subunit
MLKHRQRIGVGELTRQISKALRRFPILEVEGEIASFKVGPTGHWHFSLLEGGDKLSCILYASHTWQFKSLPQVGQQVAVRGQVMVYGARSAISLQATWMCKRGAGERLRELARRREMLTKEGLFDPSKKRPLPPFPTRVGVVTSLGAAALQDVRKVVAQRFPGFPLLICPSRVQGDVTQELIAAIAAAGARCDVVLLVRGGGAREDLAAFDEVDVVRAVAACPVPIVAGIGHGSDQTLVDLAADWVAATPSQAAERVIPKRSELLRKVQVRQDRLQRALTQSQQARRTRLQSLRLRHPQERVDQGKLRAADLSLRMQEAIGRRQIDWRRSLAYQGAQLDAYSPLKVLGRGYSLALDESGHAVRSSGALKVGDRLSLRLAEGAATVQVQDIET